MEINISGNTPPVSESQDAVQEQTEQVSVEQQGTSVAVTSEESPQASSCTAEDESAEQQAVPSGEPESETPSEPEAPAAAESAPQETVVPAETVPRKQCDFPYDGYHFSTIGASHVKIGMPCQDNSGHYVAADYSIAVIADGHSDYHCPRSEVGAKIAVDVTVNVIRERMEEEGVEQFKVDAELDEKECFISLGREILNQWKSKVREYHDAYPIEAEEYDRLLALTLKREGDGPGQAAKVTAEFKETVESSYIYSLYGSTIRIGVMFEGGYFLMSLGDGEGAAILMDGTAVTPIPHEDLGPSVTRSMCNTDAYEHIMYHYSDKEAAAVIVFSDGVTFSNRDDENQILTQRMVKDILRETITNPDWKGEIQKYIENRATYDPKDDCSVSIVFRKGLDASNFQNEKPELKWIDDPLYRSQVRPNRLIPRVSYGYAINSFDETCYKYEKG